MTVPLRDSPSVPADYLARLNPEQRQAVVHGEGRIGAPLLIIAGAGSGKTNTLAHRVAHLLLHGADPHRILMMTFSRRAADEMRRRVRRIVGEVMGARGTALCEGLTAAGTFHATGARILRERAGEVGLDPAFTIHDREDSADLLNIVRHELGLSKTEGRFPTKGTCLAIYSRAVNAEAALPDVISAQFPWCARWTEALATLFDAYVAAKQAQNVLDYDDLLLYWATLAEDADFAAEIGGDYDHILVDEYQDTNRLQARILKALKPQGRGVTVVGDDAQSIYAFRAADVRNILDFPTSFDTAATIVTLERNYRSTQPILAAANRVIAEAPERFSKTLWSERESPQRPRLVTVRDEIMQAHYVCETVLAEREAGTALKAQAVLFRTAHHSGALEVELTRRNIPFVKFGGLKFLDSAHVKDVLAVLRLAENPRDRVAGFRVLQLMPGIGPASAGGFVDAVERAGLASALESFRPPARASEDWPAFRMLMEGLSQRGAAWPADLERVRTWYRPHLERRHDDAAAREGDLGQLEQIAAGYPSRERFLTELTLDPPDATSDQAGVPLRDEDYLILSTIHSAKGQEWRSVFVLHCVDGCIPSDLSTGSTAEIEEERRLLYVAMTRARDDLHLIVPQRFYTHGQAARGDRHVHANRSRFIGDAMLGCFERKVWPPVSEAERPRPGPSTPRVDVQARMRAMWRAKG